MGIIPSLTLPQESALVFQAVAQVPTVAWSGFLLTGVQLPSKPQKPEELGCGGWRFTLCHRELKEPLLDAFLEHVEN